MADQDHTPDNGIGRRKFLALAGVSALAAVAAIMLRRRIGSSLNKPGLEDNPESNSLFKPRA